MSVSDPDPWRDEPPEFDMLRRDELVDFLEGGIDNLQLTEWERGFCISMLENIQHHNRRISNRQWETIFEIGPKLWAGDPDCWRKTDKEIADEQEGSAYRAAFEYPNEPFIKVRLTDELEEEDIDWSRVGGIR